MVLNWDTGDMSGDAFRPSPMSSPNPNVLSSPRGSLRFIIIIVIIIIAPTAADPRDNLELSWVHWGILP